MNILPAHASAGAGIATFNRVILPPASKTGTWRVRSNVLIPRGLAATAAQNPNFFKNWKFTDAIKAQRAIDALQAVGKFHSIEVDCSACQASMMSFANPDNVVPLLTR